MSPEDTPTTPENLAKSCQILAPQPGDNQSPGPPKLLTNRQNRALKALLTAKSVAEAARKASVGARSLHRWMREDPEFRRQLHETHRDSVSYAAHCLQQASVEAANNLARMVDDPDHATMPRIAAARTILEFAFRFANPQEQDERP
ncbi:MAG: hypothetical protein O3A53_16250 [Acidobacteria bacterium]|nr:hypothetical protein [Acidobacteriota bacterium]MDA1236336.1 hypothetical protein [Acidobacteriota bacterium]